ncbi:MAG: TolB family protein, partial [Gemmatimonadales bacterium]
MRRMLRILSVLPLVTLTTATAQEPYRLPPQTIVDILDAPPLPAVSLSPDRQWMLLAEQRSMPMIAEFSEPMLRLAGLRINPKTNGPARLQGFTGLLLKRVADGTERRITVPANARLAGVGWSPDSRRVAFTNQRENGIELWIADVATGAAKAVTPATLHGIEGSGCNWLPDSARLVCPFVPEGRGAAPQAPAVPVGPNAQETSGRAAPVRTYQDLLETPHDEALLDHYFTAQLALVDAPTGAISKIGAPAVFWGVNPSPNGEYLLVGRVTRPYSFLVPIFDFPEVTEVWNLRGERVAEVARLPLAETTPVGGVRDGRRGVSWRPGAPATLVVVEALDGGDTRRPAEVRDKISLLAAPFTGEPTELARTKDRFAGIRWGEGGLALLAES